MNINFNNFTQISTLNVNKNIKVNSKASDVSFCGNDENKPQDLSAVTYGNVTLHPTAALNMELLKDGYTIEQINNSGIMFISEMADIDFSDPQLVDDIFDGKITKDDIFVKTLKSARDVQAMRTAYMLLKEKYNTADVREYVSIYNKIADEINQMLSQKGKEFSNKNEYSAKDMILSVLYRVNSSNVKLMQELLDDENFNNIHIGQALLTLDKNVPNRYPMQALRMAQEVGYEKEFSLPLAIIISEANETNMGMIEKMLYEQDFLSENDDFVSTKLMNFLREAGIGLSLEYEKNDDITLKEVEELLNLEELSDEE